MIRVEVVSAPVMLEVKGAFRAMRSNLIRVISELVIEAEGISKRKLSGEVLHVRTGLLRSSITHRVQQSGDSIVGSIGTNVRYGRVHEYGFRGTVTVSQHVRRTKEQMRKAEYWYVNKDGNRVRKVRMTGKTGVGTGQTVVSQHQRRVDFPERSYLRSTLSEMADEARMRILTAVKESRA